MARIPYLQREDLEPEDRLLFDELAAERGYVPLLYQALANSPRLLRRFKEMADELRAESALPSELKETAILTVARLTGAETMRVAHERFGAQAGLTPEAIRALSDGSSEGLSGQQQAVVAYAEEATRNVQVSDAAWTLASVLLDDAQMTELVLTVAFYNMVARFLEPVRLDLDPRYERDT